MKLKRNEFYIDLETGVIYDTSVLDCYGGGKGSTPQPIYTPPPAAPATSTAATMDIAATPEEEAKKKKEAQTQGAKSLQIPLSDAASTTTVGTGA